jgi:uncharacterized protein YxjI
MQHLNYPLQLTFKVTTLSNDFIIADANEQTIAYVRQKMLKLVEEIQVYTNDDRAEQIYTIRANKWLDFSTTYAFTDRQEMEIGRVARRGWASLWKATYDIFDASQKNALQVREENPWAKVGDAVLGQIPGLNLLTGYLFHPTYGVSRPDGTLVARLSKVQSFLGRKFVIDKLADFLPGEEEPMVLGLMMMILLERQRG